MLLRTVILLLLISLTSGVWGQDVLLIGMSKEDVKALVKQEHRDFAPDNSIVRQQFNYLKYVNGRQTVTWIIYFSDDDICTSAKKVCDYTEYDFVLDALKDACKKIDKHTWRCRSGRQDYMVFLVEHDWYFTVQQRLPEKQN